MHFLTALAVALPLVSSLPADSSTSSTGSLQLNPPLSSLQTRVFVEEPLCGLVGHDLHNPDSFLTKSFRCVVGDCADLCDSKPECKSYAVSSLGCALYAARVEGNFEENEDSHTTFYDKNCGATSSTSATGVIETSSSTPLPTVTVIRIEDTNGNQLGYMGNDFNLYGERGIIADITAALHVKASYRSGASSLQADVTSDNSAKYADLLALALINGFSSTDSNLGNSYNYAVLGASDKTAPGATPQFNVDNSFTRAINIVEDVESAVWSIHPSTMELLPHWVNTDESLPPIYTCYVQDFLLVTGSVSSLRDAFGVTVTEVRMFFEEHHVV
ncbi:hypothetical protein B0T10DRAFT_543103 [Thelonectria olida]|uniref:Apple domain-containing protein n=1 Tax=Thelonectria olida TaxID=1576542 RepID=A0A9P9AUP5_9HYPO|nr:hypothetical protein B0T10DRAFT_543103 [Thelonectria olida]